MYAIASPHLEPFTATANFFQQSVEGLTNVGSMPAFWHTRPVDPVSLAKTIFYSLRLPPPLPFPSRLPKGEICHVLLSSRREMESGGSSPHRMFVSLCVCVYCTEYHQATHGNLQATHDVHTDT